MLLLIISFFAGVLTVLAPCVLPLLPVIIGGSVNGKAKQKDKSRPYVIAGSLAGSIVVFTLLLKASTILVNIPPNLLNWISGILLIGLGIAAALPSAWERLVVRYNWESVSQRFLGKGGKSKGKYAGPVLVGVALGPVFASCSPTYAFILASVLPHSFGSGLFYLAFYSLGLVLALLVISLAGRKAISKYRWAVDTHSTFRRSIGLLFIIIGLVIFAGKEVAIETWLGNHLPFDETKIERVLLTKQNKNSLSSKAVKPSSVSDNGVLNIEPTPAPELAGLTNWINSQPLTLKSLKGKVVLVDFWTYSCINCIRTLPYIEKWNQTYKDKGLVIIGVNTPEFAFEHNPDNVAAAVKKFGITYPVALDNNYDTWNAYTNQSWPADYLIDKNGDVRYISSGEGDYDKTEKAIQTLLGVNQSLQTPASVVPITESQTPETYFGSNRSRNFSGGPPPEEGIANFTPSSNVAVNYWTLSGSWAVAKELITSQNSNSQLIFHVNAKDVYVVASNAADRSDALSVGLPEATGAQFGVDAPEGIAMINGSKLYHIVSLKNAGETTVTLTVPAGVSLYTFTFGS